MQTDSLELTNVKLDQYSIQPDIAYRFPSKHNTNT
jgi:hypothetical protein